MGRLTCGGEGLTVALGQHGVVGRRPGVRLQHWVGKEVVPQRR